MASPPPRPPSASGSSLESAGLLAASPTRSSTGAAAAAASREATNAVNRRRFIEGIVLLIIVNILWTGASVLVQYIYKDRDFHQPLFVTYVSNSLFMVYLAGSYVIHSEPVHMPKQKSLLQTAKIGLYICPVWFAAQGTYNASLNYTSISSSTILSTLSGLFTFGLSLLILKEVFKCWKVAGVLASLLGAVLVSLNDDGSSGHGDSLGGDALALGSAMCYAAYTTMIRFFIPDERCVSMPLFFGFLGLANAILMAPLLVVLIKVDYVSLESLTPTTFAFVVLKGLADNVLSDLIWARAVVLTSPTIATVGLTLTIPLAMVSDWLFNGEAPTLFTALASLAVIAGFILVNLGGQHTTPLEGEEEEQEEQQPEPASPSRQAQISLPTHRDGARGGGDYEE